MLAAVTALLAAAANGQTCDASRSCRAACQEEADSARLAECLATCGNRDAQLCRPPAAGSAKMSGEAGLPVEPRPSRGFTLAPGKPAAKRRSASPIATRLFAVSDFRIPDGFGAIAVLIFPNEAALDPARQRRVCRAFVAVLDDSTAVLAANPRREQMVTIWPVTQASPAFRLTEARRHDSAAIDAICPDAVASYDYSKAADWTAKLPSRVRPGRGFGPYLVAWAPPQQAGDPRVPVLTYDLSGFSEESQLLAAFRIWKHDIEDDPQLWAGGWNLTRWQLTTRAMVDRYGSQIGEAMKLVPWLGSDAEVAAPAGR